MPASSSVTVFSDSQYVVNTMTRNWKRNANKDLWARLDAEVRKRDVAWQWIRGHAGDPLNEEADRLANMESRREAGLPDNPLSHVDEGGKARMVDVGSKPETRRVAVVEGSVRMRPETLELIRANAMEKGDVLAAARIAGIMGAKSTPQLIPLCQPATARQRGRGFRAERPGWRGSDHRHREDRC